MNNILRICLFIGALATCICTIAQKHEVSGYIAGGISTLNAKTTNVSVLDTKDKIGGQIGVNYNYNVKPYLAIISGVELASYKSEYKSDYISGKYNTLDNEGDNVEFAFALKDFKEDVTALYLNIPLMVRYTYAVNDKLGIYVAGGGKIGFAIDGSYKSTRSDLSTTGTYYQWGQGTDYPVYDDEPEQGFGKYGSGSNKGDVDLEIMYTASGELGIKHDIGEKYALYIGGYFDYALNNINKNTDSKVFVEYNREKPSQVLNNSVANSSYVLRSRGFMKNMKPISAGIKIRFSYRL